MNKITFKRDGDVALGKFVPSTGGAARMPNNG